MQSLQYLASPTGHGLVSDPVDLEQPGRAGRSPLHHLHERTVGQDHVGRDAGAVGRVRAPGLQALPTGLSRLVEGGEAGTDVAAPVIGSWECGRGGVRGNRGQSTAGSIQEPRLQVHGPERKPILDDEVRLAANHFPVHEGALEPALVEGTGPTVIRDGENAEVSVHGGPKNAASRGYRPWTLSTRSPSFRRHPARLLR